MQSCREKEDLARQASLPVVRLTTDDGSPVTSKTVYKAGTIVIEDADSTFTAQMEIRGRGNTTWDPENIPKLPYRLKLKERARLFGLSTDKSWNLLANWSDKSLLRNRVCFELSKIVGMEWTPRSVPVEVYFNGEYVGVYDFIEHRTISPERVNIDTKSGDIYFELENNLDSPVCWTTELGHPVNFKEPENPQQSQIDYAKQFFKDFEDALSAKQYSRVYDEFIDVDSFINNYIVEEFSKDIDGILRKSTFLTLKNGGKLQMYNLWDFDITFGNCDYYQDGQEPWEGWWVRTHNQWGTARGWYWLMFQDPVFVEKVKQRWNEVYPDFQQFYYRIDKMAEEMGGAPKRNFEKWPILDKYVWPNYKVTGSYKAEVEWLKENYLKRLEWMNTNINKL